MGFLDRSSMNGANWRVRGGRAPDCRYAGTCENGHSITRDKIEARVLAGLKDRLVSAEAVAEAVRADAEEMNRLNHDRRAQAATDQKALANVERAIAGIIAAIEDGM